MKNKIEEGHTRTQKKKEKKQAWYRTTKRMIPRDQGTSSVVANTKADIIGSVVINVAHTAGNTRSL